jgi:signal peptidase I
LTVALAETGVFLNVSTELLSSGLSMRFRAYGGSMHPTIRCEELITVVPVEACEIRRGDVILYRTKRESVMAHRVVRIEGAGCGLRFITRGDALVECDEAVEAVEVLGKVVSVLRSGSELRLACAGERMRRRVREGRKVLRALLPVGVRRVAGSLARRIETLSKGNQASVC